MGREKARVVFTDRSVQCAKVGRTQVTGTTGLYLVVNESGHRIARPICVMRLSASPGWRTMAPCSPVSAKLAEIVGMAISMS